MSFEVDTSKSQEEGTMRKALTAWTRDNRDNKLFKELQVKDMSTITNDDTIFAWDADGIPFKCAGMVEEDYIQATNVETSEVHEAKNVTEFWGVGKKVGANSWVGVKNIDREVNEQELWTKESFTIEKLKRLKTKFINSVTGKRFKKDTDPIENKVRVDMDLSDVVDIMEARINEVRVQWDVKKFLMCLGSGEVFRDSLPLPQPYKGQRDPLRPILLKEARKWLEENYPSEIAPPLFETDDVVEWYAALSHAIFRKTGIHSYVIIAEDKDSAGNPKLWVNYGRAEGQFKQPQAVLIQDSSVSVGTLELVQKSKTTETKGTGLKWIVMQAFCFGDSSDNYHPYLKLDKELRSHIKYGQKEAYKDFVKLDTPKLVLQKAVDNMLAWFPHGLQYTTHAGYELDVDTMFWMNDVCFPVAYMTRSQKDSMTFKKLCTHFDVDVSGIVGNNKLSAPEPTFVGNGTAENLVRIIQDSITSLLDNELTSYKSLKKGDLVDRMNDVATHVETLQVMLSDFWTMEQKEK